MNELDVVAGDHPLVLEPPFYLVVALWTGLSLEAFFRRDRGWGLVAMVVYLTVALWYAADLFITPDIYAGFEPDYLNTSFFQVGVFLVAYRLFTAPLAKMPDTNTGGIAVVPVQTYLKVIVPAWALLLVWGVIRMDGDVAGALWPVQGRSGPHMWSRGQLGKGFDSLVSVGGYIYTFLCASFGVLMVVATKGRKKLFCLALVLVAWPYFFFLGARNLLLAVIMPGVFAFLFKDGRVTKTRGLAALGILFVINHLMLAMLQFRQSGFQEFIRNPFAAVEQEQSHEGLNMIEELTFMNMAHDAGLLPLTLGRDYLAHAATVVPRVLWPNKPRISADYSMLRGQEETMEGTVTATIATGLIGQGFINFGPFFGPAAAAGLMALYTWILCAQWRRRAELPRLLLFLLGVGLTPNLGREFTLLVLWPLVFAYALVRAFEHWQSTHEENSRPSDDAVWGPVGQTSPATKPAGHSPKAKRPGPKHPGSTW